MSGPQLGEYELGGGRTAAGWPFLIARGRRRGYTILLAPDFLVTAREYGFLEEVAGTSQQDAPVRTARATTPGGRPVCLVWTEYAVRAADLTDGDGTDPVDEHSRPLRLVRGFLCVDGAVTQVSPADLDHAHRAALATYREFLDDEDGFTVRPSAAFGLTSVLTAPHRSPAARTSPEGAMRRVDTRRWSPVATAVTVFGVVLVAVALVIGIQLLGSSPGRPAPTVCPSVTVTAPPVATTLVLTPGGSGVSPAPKCPGRLPDHPTVITPSVTAAVGARCQDGPVTTSADVAAYWDTAASSFDTEPDHGLTSPSVRAAWARQLRAWLPDDGADVLDVGCGTGSLALVLAQQGHLVTGVDLSRTMVEHARRKLADHPAAVLLGDAADPPVHGRRFDVVLCRHLLWTLPDPVAALRRWVGMLRPGGHLVLVEGRWGAEPGTSTMPWWGGVPSDVLSAAVRPLVARTHVEHLTDPLLWGRTISDERYVVLAHV